MTDLLDRLAALRPEAAAPSDDTVAADVRRGRRAHTRRRAARAAVGVAVVTAVGGTTYAVAAGHSPGREATGPRLVAYTGDQLPGFTVAKVPDGFVLQGATAYSLDVAAPGDHSDLADFEDKIVVTIEADDDLHPRSDASAPRVHLPRGARIVRDGPRVWIVRKDGSRVQLRSLTITPGAADPADDPIGTTIDVDGDAGTLRTNSEGTKTFRYDTGTLTVVIQVWPTIQLSDAQVREFADGVTVTPQAQLSHG